MLKTSIMSAMGGLGGETPQIFFAILGAKILLKNTKKKNLQTRRGQNDCQNLARHNCNQKLNIYINFLVIFEIDAKNAQNQDFTVKSLFCIKISL